MISTTPQEQRRNLTERIANRKREIARIEASDEPSIYDKQIIDLLVRGIAADEIARRRIRISKTSEVTQ